MRDPTELFLFLLQRLTVGEDPFQTSRKAIYYYYYIQNYTFFISGNKNWVCLQHFIVKVVALQCTVPLKTRGHDFLLWIIVISDSTNYLLHKKCFFFCANGPRGIIKLNITQPNTPSPDGLLWKLLLGNTNPVWALLKRCWVKFQVLCPWAPIWAWTLDFSLSCFQLYVSSVCKRGESPKSHTNKQCEVLYSYADSQRRHVGQIHYWWKTIRGTWVRKPHINLSRAGPTSPSAVMKGEKAPLLLASFVYLPSELHPAPLGPCSNVFCYVSFQTEYLCVWSLVVFG